MLNPNRLDPDNAMLLVIDYQQKLLPLIHDNGPILEAAKLLFKGVRIFNLPILVTEQYPKGIGPTDESLADILREQNADILEKQAFSCCGQSTVREKLRDIDRPQIIVCGIEAHVCVQQTVLDLRMMDHDVFVCADAIGSRQPFDFQIALDRMRQAGAQVTTVESVLFELCNECGTERFKQMIELIKTPRKMPTL